MSKHNDNSKKHKVKIHTWVKGILETAVHEFDQIDEAKEFAESHSNESVIIKVYDIFDELVFHYEFNAPDQFYA